MTEDQKLSDGNDRVKVLQLAEHFLMTPLQPARHTVRGATESHAHVPRVWRWHTSVDVRGWFTVVSFVLAPYADMQNLSSFPDHLFTAK